MEKERRCGTCRHLVIDTAATYRGMERFSEAKGHCGMVALMALPACLALHTCYTYSGTDCPAWKKKEDGHA